MKIKDCNKHWDIISLADCTDLNNRAASWFHEKWQIPEAVYLESIIECQKNPSGLPKWYIAINNEDKIIGGLGLIENDFHKRKDLTPNVCALFVEKDYRKCNIAKELLELVCDEAYKAGYRKLYLITEHDQFYEKCGWHFLCRVEEENGHLTRMYEKNLSVLNSSGCPPINE